MRFILIFALITLSMLCGSIFAQNIEYVSSTFWSGISDVKVVGNYAYCAFINGLVILDVSDQTNPVFVSKLYFQGYGSTIDIAGDYVYLGISRHWDEPPSLKVINISDPFDPTLIGGFDYYSGNTSFTDSYISGDYIYLTFSNYNTGGILIILDITDPSNPVLIGEGDAGDRDLFVSGSYAYTNYYLAFSPALIITDVSDPYNPVNICTYQCGDYPTNITDIAVSGNYVIFSTDDEDLVILDISDPFNPSRMGTYFMNGYYAEYLNVEGVYAYLTGNMSSDSAFLEIVDISDPNNPVFEQNYINHNSSGYGENCYFNNTVYAISSGSAVHIIDVSNIQMPFLAGNYNTISSTVGVFYDNDYLYTLNYGFGFHIIDPAIPDNPVITAAFETPGQVLGFFVADNYVYIVDGDSGLQIVDVSDPYDPEIIGSFGDLNIRSVIVQDNYAYVYSYLGDSTSISIIDVSYPSVPILTGVLEIPDSYIGHYFVSGNYAYYTGGYHSSLTVQVIDVTDPSNPTLRGRHEGLSGGPIFVLGDYAYILLAPLGSALRVINISNPDSIFLVGGYGSFYDGSDIYVDGDYAYIAGGPWNDTGIIILNISDPSDPTFVTSYDTPGYPKGVFPNGEYLYMADIYSLLIFHFDPGTGISEVADIPYMHTLSQNYPNPFNSSTVISYDVPYQSQVIINIYDILGRRVCAIQDGLKPAGNHQVIWNAIDLPSGMYFYKLQAGDYTETKKMVLMK